MKNSRLLKIFLTVACLVILLTAFGILSASAETYSGTFGGENDSNLTWSLDTETGVLEISGTGSMETPTYEYPWDDYKDSIVSVIINDGITDIGYSAFYDLKNLVSVEIPNSVTIIYGDAFFGCGSLTGIELPQTITSIGDSVFYNCFSLKSIEIPNSVVSIGTNAFLNCDSLTNIEIPDSVVSIGNGAFWCCESLTSVKLPQTITSIGDSVFYGCVSLTSIEIPDSVVSIGDSAFGSCESLTSIEIPDSVVSIDEYAFSECESLTSVEIPDSVTDLGRSAFSSCYSLRCVIIGNGVQEISKSTFYSCRALESVTIGSDVSSIADNAFYNCYSIHTLTVDEDNQYFSADDCVLYDKDEKTLIKVLEAYKTGAVVVPDTVEIICENAFEYIASIVFMSPDTVIPEDLTGTGTVIIGYADSTAQTYAEACGYTFIEISEDNIISGELAEGVTWSLSLTTGTLDISGSNENAVTIDGDGVEVDDPWWNFRNLIKILNIQDGVNAELGWGAFNESDNLEKVVIGDSVSYIDGATFIHCYSFTEITVSANNEKYCSVDGVLYSKDASEVIIIPMAKTGELELPASVSSFSYYYCESGNSLSKITVASGNNAFCAVDGILYSADMELLVLAPGKISGEITVPDGVVTVGECAFYDCDNITSVILPNSVEIIEYCAFFDCGNLKSVDFGDSLIEIGINAFACCTSLTSIELPDSVVDIGYRAFGNCTALTSAKLSDNLSSVAEQLFSNCYSLETMNIPNSVSIIGGWAFQDCRSLSDITLGSGVTEIGDYAFSLCGYKSIHIPASVEAIGEYVFWDCKEFEEFTVDEENGVYEAIDGLLYLKESKTLITVPEGISGDIVVADGTLIVAEDAFDDCEKVSSITLPDSVTTLESYAISITNCSTLKSVTLGNGVTTIADYALYYNNGLKSINIPNSVVTIGVSAFERCYSLQEIVISESVESVGENAFYDCDSLTGITFMSSDTEIYDSENTIPESATIYGYEDSTAQAYATAYGRTFSVLDDNTSDEPSEIPSDAPVITVESVKAKLGNTVDVTVSIKNNPSFAFLNLYFTYPEGLTLTDVTNGIESLGFAYDKTMVWDDASDYSEDGTLITLTFEVDEDMAVGTYQISSTLIEAYNEDLDDVSFNIVNGEIEIYDFIYGDVTGDDEINGKDIIMIRKYIAAKDPITGESSVEVGDGADCNGDGVINGKDVILLRKYIAGKDPITGESSIVLGPTE